MYEFGSVLSVPKAKGFVNHMGMYVGQGLVFHNHPSSGERLVSLANFAKGRTVTVADLGVSQPLAIMSRLKESLADPSPYRSCRSNCDHTVFKLRTGIPHSPQLRFFCLLGVACIAITVSLLKKR